MEDQVMNYEVNEKYIKELMEFYIKDFKIRTGLTLSVMIRRKRKPKSQIKKITKDEIVKLACEYLGVPKKQLASNSRVSGLVKPRMMVAALLSKMGMTSTEIAEVYGQNRSTISNTLQMFKKRYKELIFKEEYLLMASFVKNNLDKELYYQPHDIVNQNKVKK